MTAPLGRRTVGAVRLTFAAGVVGGLVQAAILVALARLLTPLDYGLAAGAWAIVRPIQNILFSGLERAMILHPGLANRDLGAVAGMNLVLGVAATLVVLLIAGIAWLTPALHSFAPTLAALSPVLSIFGLGVAARATLRKRMAFRRLAAAELGAQIAGQALVAVVLARAGFGPLSLVIGYLVQAVIEACTNLANARIPLRLQFDWASIAPVWRTAFSISKTSLVELVHAQAPTAILAALGPVPLGLFNRAWSLIQLPTELIGASMSRVLYSGFSLVRDDLERLRRACRALVELGSAAAIPLCCAMGAAAPDLVHVVLGDRWSGIVPMVPWICLGSIAGLVAHFYAVMTEASVQLKARFRVQLWATLALLTALLVALKLGVEAGAAAFAFGNVVFLVGNIRLCARILEVRAPALLSWSAPAAATGLCLVFYVLAIRGALAALPAAPRLAVEVAGCGLLSVAIYAVFWRRTALDILRYCGGAKFLPASLGTA